MTGRVPFLLALLMLAGSANSQNLAEHPAECRVAEQLVERDFRLPQVTRALAAKQLNILVVGAGSTLLPGANGGKNAYPARLQHALTEMLPGVEVKVVTDVKVHRNAVETVKTLAPVLAAAKPALVVWGIGTVDAIQAIDTDQFSHALDKGTNIARSAGADVVFMVINIGLLKTGDHHAVEEDIRAVRRATRANTILKVIIETAFLTQDEKVMACELSRKAGADFVKTCTGFGGGGATVEDISLMRRTVGREMGVKASGGVRTYKTAIALIGAGASRIGCVSSVAIVTGAEGTGSY